MYILICNLYLCSIKVLSLSLSMFSGPYKSCKELEQFSYMTLWGGSKTLTLWMNSVLTEQTADNLKQVLKNYCVPDDHQFCANRMEMRHLSQHSGESFQDF